MSATKRSSNRLRSSGACHTIPNIFKNEHYSQIIPEGVLTKVICTPTLNCDKINQMVFHPSSNHMQNISQMKRALAVLAQRRNKQQLQSQSNCEYKQKIVQKYRNYNDNLINNNEIQEQYMQQYAQDSLRNMHNSMHNSLHNSMHNNIYDDENIHNDNIHDNQHDDIHDDIHSHHEITSNKKQRRTSQSGNNGQYNIFGEQVISNLNFMKELDQFLLQ